ncbi:hypothetical protein HQN64_19605 [Enterobacteriaceae bacterium BIT-l23]|uniref:hypothetical protein n=1 Tax=Jejubacter sp. L23 TaxID=3092086 RepID=UPI00158505C0|nr:hypothetical protein [Enterobacteriaceae bacterium BIT-l23]
MKQTSAEEFIEIWNRQKKKEGDAIQQAAPSMIPNILGKAVVTLISQNQQLTTESLINYLEDQLQRTQGNLLESWNQTALQFLKDSASPK